MFTWLVCLIIFASIGAVLLLDRWLRKDKTQALSARYWQILPGESTRLYNKLGVRLFKKYMPTTGDWMLKHFWYRCGLLQRGTVSYIPSRKQGLAALIGATKALEFVHLALLVVTSVGLGRAIVQDHSLKNILTIVVGWHVINLPANVYPILVQRYNRMRARTALRKMQQHQPLPAS